MMRVKTLRPVDLSFIECLGAALRPWISREARRAARLQAARELVEKRRRESAAAAAALDMAEIECSALSLPDRAVHIGPALDRCAECVSRELDARAALDALEAAAQRRK